MTRTYNQFVEPFTDDPMITSKNFPFARRCLRLAQRQELLHTSPHPLPGCEYTHSGYVCSLTGCESINSGRRGGGGGGFERKKRILPVTRFKRFIV